MKKCNKCGMIKDYDEFCKKSINKDGYTNICKTCNKKYREIRKNIHKPILETKTCCSCGKIKSSKGFHKNKSSKDGLCSSCKKCNKIKAQNVINSNKQIPDNKFCNKCKNIKHKSEFYSCKRNISGLETYCISCDKDRAKNKKKIPTPKIKTCYRCKTSFYSSFFNKDAYSKDGISHICKNCSRESQKINKRNKEKDNERHKHRYRNDVSYKLKHKIRRRILECLKQQKTNNYKGSLKYLGCTVEFYKKYLESLFKPGMTWDNHGIKGWHIDHIIPCSSFDLTKEEEIFKCFNYKNTQPLWWRENILKSNTIPHQELDSDLS